jgi:hypothetical protein
MSGAAGQMMQAAPGQAATALGAGGAAPAPQLPHDIRGLLPYSPPWWTYALYALIALADIGATLAFVSWRRRRGSLPAAPVDPWEALAARAQALEPRAPFARAEQEEFFFHLSMILREGIELRTGIRATDLTYQELREPVRRKLPLPAADVDDVLAFCERADLVKFAAAETGRAEADEARGRVVQWLERLKPTPLSDLPHGQISGATAASGPRAAEGSKG